MGMRAVLAILSLMTGSAVIAQEFHPVVAEGVNAYEAGDHAKARSLFSQACDAGQAEGCYRIGFMLEKGKAAPLTW